MATIPNLGFLKIVDTPKSKIVKRSRRCVYAKEVRFRIQVGSGADGIGARSDRKGFGEATWNRPRGFIPLEATA